MSQSADKQPVIFAVVLAAGKASRFGTSKQLSTFEDESLVHRATRIAREVCGPNSVLVAGHDASNVIAAADGGCEFLIVNEDYEHGMGSSIALAARALGRIADALLLILADQVLVTTAHLQDIVTAWPGTDEDIVASAYGGTSGPPVLLPSGCLPELAAMGGDQGARQLFSDERFRVTTIDFEDAGVDIDTPADLARLS